MIKESLFAAEEREAKLDKMGDILQIMEKHLDFKASHVDQVAPRPSQEKGGRPPFPTELMVRVLVLQQLHGLSDEQMEYQLLDRLSFQRFAGSRHSSQIPDRTTIWTFRERLIAASASDSLFDGVERQLHGHGYIARCGQLVDASIVPAPKQKLKKDEKALIDQPEQAMPSDWLPAKRRQKDIDATWTNKHGKSYFGYKLTVNADKRYKLIRKIKVTTAKEHDTLHLDDVLDSLNTSRDLYADKGYVDAEREARLKAEGYHVHIQRKAKKGKPLSDCQQRRNTRIAKTRSRVEHVFASLEQLGSKQLRSIGLGRATLQLNLKAATYNIRRLCSLKTGGILAF